MFLNFEKGVDDPEEDSYFGAGEHVSFAEKVEELGKAGTKILKEFSVWSGSKAYINNIENFNLEQQIAILQEYLKIHPYEAEELFKKVKALDFPLDMFESQDYDNEVTLAFRDKRRQEIEMHHGK